MFFIELSHTGDKSQEMSAYSWFFLTVSHSLLPDLWIAAHISDFSRNSLHIGCWMKMSLLPEKEKKQMFCLKLE